MNSNHGTSPTPTCTLPAEGQPVRPAPAPQVLAVSAYLRSECCHAPVEQTHEPEPELYPVRCSRCRREAGAPGAEDVPEAVLAVLADRWRQDLAAWKARTIYLGPQLSTDPRALLRISAI